MYAPVADERVQPVWVNDGVPLDGIVELARGGGEH